jgi:hypothetical protein
VLLSESPDWQNWIVLAPALVIGAGLVAGVLILLGRGLAQSIRESGHTRLILLGLAGVVAAVVLLTYLGVSLPKE